MIVIDSKRKKRENILKKYPGAIIADVTSHAEDDLIKLSPILSSWFLPSFGRFGIVVTKRVGIPVPFSEGVTATCVGGCAFMSCWSLPSSKEEEIISRFGERAMKENFD